MQPLLLASGFVLTAVFSLSAQGNIPQPTHLVVQIAPTTGVPLSKTEEVFYYYDNNGNPYQSKTNTWDGSNWIFSERGYYTLNIEGKPTEILERKWDTATSTLVDAQRTTIGYHTDGQENYRKTETWAASINNWEPGIIQTTSFTLDNRVLEFTLSTFDAGMQINGIQSTYAYDSVGRLSERIEKIWDNGILGNRSKSDFLYSGSSGDFETVLTRNWDEADSAWAEITFRHIQTVTDTQRVVLAERLLGGIWTPNSLVTTKYDAKNQTLEETAKTWDVATMDWIVFSRYEYAYNADQSISQFKYSVKDNAGILHLFMVIEYDYGNYPVSTYSPTARAKVTLSPNPTTDFVRVQVEGQGIANLTLLDLRGNVIARTSTASPTAQLSLQGQPSGTYFLRVEQGGAVKVLPVVKN